MFYLDEQLIVGLIFCDIRQIFDHYAVTQIIFKRVANGVKLHLNLHEIERYSTQLHKRVIIVQVHATCWHKFFQQAIEKF